MRYSQAVPLLIALCLGSALAQDGNAPIRLGYDHGKPIYFTPGFYTLQDGLAEAQRTGKYVLVLYDALRPVGSPQDQVLTCVNFDQRAERTEALATFTEAGVIVRLDPNAPREGDLRFSSYPQFLVLDRTGKILVGSSDHNRLPDLVANLGSLAEANQIFAQGLDSALEQARTQDKPVLVNVYSSDPRSFVPSFETWYKNEVAGGAPVGLLQLPDATVLGEARNLVSLSDPAVVSRIQQDFVACGIEGFQERGFMQRYHVLGYPTLLFLTSEGEEITRLQGAVNPEQILVTASEALASYRQGKTAEPLLPWEDPWIAFERAERENKPVFLFIGGPSYYQRALEVMSRVEPDFLQTLREDFICLHLVGSGRGFSGHYSDPGTGASFHSDSQPWIVRVNGKQMPEQCFEHLLKNVYVPIAEIPEPLFQRYVVSGAPMRRGTPVLSRTVWLGTGLEELGIRDRFGARAVYFLDGQQAVRLASWGGGQGGCEVYLLDPQGEPLLYAYSFKQRGRSWTSPEFYEVLIEGTLRLWYGEDGFAVRDIGAALAEARETGKQILLCRQSRGATTFETYTLFDELRDALEQLGYIPALINSASTRIVELPDVGRMPEWRAWMELQLWNEPLRFAGWPAYAVLAPDGSLVGEQIPGYVDTDRWIAALEKGGLGVGYAQEVQLARQVEAEWQQVQQALAQGNWDLIEQMHRSKRVQVRWSNVEGPYTLILLPPAPGFSRRDRDLVAGARVQIPTELGKRLRERQLMTPDEIQRMIERAGGPPQGGRRTTNTQGQEVIEIDAP